MVKNYEFVLTKDGSDCKRRYKKKKPTKFNEQLNNFKRSPDSYIKKARCKR